MNFFLSILLVFHVVLMLHKNVAFGKSPLSEYSLRPLERSSVYLKKEFLINFCVSHVKTNYQLNSISDWSCSQTKSIEAFTSTHLNNKTLSNRIYCFCWQDYACIDREHFHLEPHLVQLDEYVNVNNTHFYKKECEQNLSMLTSEEKWSCDLQFDRLDKHEFYCECKRDMVCQRHKILKFQSHVRLAQEDKNE
jgi:hypothetical protein